MIRRSAKPGSTRATTRAGAHGISRPGVVDPSAFSIRNTISTALAVVLVMTMASLGVVTSASAASGPYNIDGNVPDSGLTAIFDPSGSTKELGPINGSATKIGVIHKAQPPMLGMTNPNGQVDLSNVWLDLQRVGTGTSAKDWLYFAWERNSNSGSGYIAYEFMKNAAPSACAYGSATDAALIEGCNPFASRAADDFMILWDQQGGNRELLLRTWSGTGSDLTLSAGTALNSTLSAAEYSSDGFRGEAAINITDALRLSTSGCTTIANTVPSTVTGNSDSADYKDTVLTRKVLTTCGSVSIRKVDDSPTPVLLANAGFTLYSNAAPLATRGSEDTELSALTCSTNTSGVCTISAVPFGEYWVVESTTPSGYDTAADQRVAVSSTTPTPATLTFINPRQVGSILIRKTDGTNDLAGATFSAQLGTATAVNIPLVSGSTSLFCLGGLPLGGTYAIAETTTPTNYNPQTSIPDVTVSTQSTCAARVAETPVVVDLTVANTRKVGSILIRKTDGTNALAGATFSAQLGTDTAVNIPLVSGSTSLFCLGNLPTNGVYAIVETTTPPGYNGATNIPSVTVSTESTCAARVAAEPVVPDRTVTNNAAPGTINISKVDDRDLALAGAAFKLYRDANSDGEWQASELTQQGTTQTTGADGTASFANVPLGDYCVVETTVPTGHTRAAPQCVTVGVGEVAGEGQTIGLEFTNPRTHRVIVLVCHEGTDTLEASSVTLGSTTKTSLSGSGISAEDQKVLCDTGGASFRGLSHGTHAPSAVIASH